MKNYFKSKSKKENKMKNYLVSYSSEGTVAGTVVYAVENYGDLFELAVRDFFDFDNGEVTDEVMREYIESGDFYGTCARFGIDFGDITPLDEALEYVRSLADYKN